MHLFKKGSPGVDSGLIPTKVSLADGGIRPDASLNPPSGNIKSNDDTLELLLKASVIGASTGGLVVLFKTSIQTVQRLLYEDLADVLPKPAFYWPIILYPIIGSTLVVGLRALRGDRLNNDVNSIARKLRLDTDIEEMDADAARGGVQDTLFRTLAAVATLGSGCSLGPEGPAVEIGTRVSAAISGVTGGNGKYGSSRQDMRDLFLAGAAAGVGAGFNAPIAGIFFAIECGSKYLTEEKDIDVSSRRDIQDTRGGGAMKWLGPTSRNTSIKQGTDIAAMVIAATVADLVVGLGLHESQALSVQGNLFAMKSPIFELPLYIGLGLVAGVVAVSFETFRNESKALYSQGGALGTVPKNVRPILAGVLCGITALFLPQTLFVGYATLDDILAGKIHPGLPLSTAMLAGKMVLSAFALESGLIGGVFAPSLFFGAVLGNLYHDVNLLILQSVQAALPAAFASGETESVLSSFAAGIASLKLANAPAYATVGAASVLSAIFKAPLTSCILMLELTENHDIVVPLLVAAATSTQASFLLRQYQQSSNNRGK